MIRFEGTVRNAAAQAPIHEAQNKAHALRALQFQGNGARAGWLSPQRAAICGAVLLGALPLWALPIAAAGRSGFLAYLHVSQAYYGGARRLFGATLFPMHEFGIVPQGAAGLVLAAAVYAVLGATVGWTLARALMRWRAKRVLGNGRSQLSR